MIETNSVMTGMASHVQSMTEEDFVKIMGRPVTPKEKLVNKFEGLKYDQDKPRMDLLDPDHLEDVARVLSFGARKYAAHNWRNGIAVSRLIAASYRHLGAINRGEDIDPESGLPHTAHLGCCVMFLGWTLANKPEMDDRWTNSTTDEQ